ncbi:hypothetical protein SLEP1_g59703 [Rubroshorea leprosula]|uniref:Secreted protein n=1 Tax=Rubroshorea leprosula TaxID=152421 RepID=A0AAV5MUF0_9ROSI|nr:hypothetical protein SLEP1_g59703 [Rubroshorea leprosula]
MAVPVAPVCYVGVAGQCLAFHFMRQTGGIKKPWRWRKVLVRRSRLPVARPPLHETNGTVSN